MSYHNPPQENNIYKTDIVMPNIIQIIWSKSPAYFCASSETEICIDNEIARTKIVITPEHPLEKHTTTKLSTALQFKPYMLQLVRWIIEFYVDDFIGMEQNTPKALLRHISRSILTSIYEVFMTPHRSGHKEGGSLAIKYHLQRRRIVHREGYFRMELQWHNIPHLLPHTQCGKDKKGNQRNLIH